ncbi:hypothetical protein BH11ACT3_BH11ACT3_18020 [soil metagenome]
MTDQAEATRVVPAGWYQDPASAALVRWWNGVTWTEHTAEKPTITPNVEISPVSVSADAAAASTADKIAEARALEREFGISTAEHAIMTGAAPSAYPSTGSLAIVKSDAAAATVTPRAVRTSTIPAWLLGISPIFAFVVTVVGAFVYLYVSPSPLVLGLVAALWLIGLLWAVADQRTVAARGLAATSPAWALLTPLVYLIMRRRRVAGSGPLIAFLAVIVLAIGIPAVLSATGGIVPLTTALAVQQELQRGLVETGQAQSVSCPAAIVDNSVGEFVTCDVVLSDGTKTHAIFSFDDVDGGFSYTLSLRG